MSTATGRLRTSWSQNYAEWMVILVVAVALLAGWGVRTYAESWVGRASTATGPALTVSYPAWWLSSADGGDLRFRDVRAGGVPPAIEVRAANAAQADQAVHALALEADSLSLGRGRELSAYRILSTDTKATYRGAPALEVSYVYVLDKADAFQQQLPVVMLGEDMLVYQAGRVFVFSLQAPQDGFDQAQRRFRALVDSATFGS